MKKYFTTGLVILLPVAVTIMLVMFFVNILTKPLIGFVQALFNRYDLFQTSFLSHPEIVLLISKIFILIFLFIVVVFIGIVGRWIFIRYVLHIGDSLMHRIPMVNKIYKATQDVVHTVLSPDTSTFKQVVLVPFPHAKGLSIGLITKEDATLDINEVSHNLISVFVPGTPNPTMGFMLMFKKEQLIYTDISVEEALKCVVSCGVILNSFKSKKH